MGLRADGRYSTDKQSELHIEIGFARARASRGSCARGSAGPAWGCGALQLNLRPRERDLMVRSRGPRHLNASFRNGKLKQREQGGER